MEKFVRIVVVSVESVSALVAFSAAVAQHYYCKYCGLKSSSIASLTSSKCQRHPDGALKCRHAPEL